VIIAFLVLVLDLQCLSYNSGWKLKVGSLFEALAMSDKKSAQDRTELEQDRVIIAFGMLDLQCVTRNSG
jgi:hypothetical protein